MIRFLHCSWERSFVNLYRLNRHARGHIVEKNDITRIPLPCPSEYAISSEIIVNVTSVI